MTNVVVSGSRGFIGANLSLRLEERADVRVHGFDTAEGEPALIDALDCADIFYHIAGVNRPKEPSEFDEVNHLLTQRLMDHLARNSRRPIVVLSSSTQAALDNPYGMSKRAAEDAMFGYAEETGAKALVYRLTNTFGKWSRPFYNSVVATFCHQGARGEAMTINDANARIELVYIDDVLDSMIGVLDGREPLMAGRFAFAQPIFPITVGELAERIRSFAVARGSGFVPDFADPFTKRLWATFLTHLPPDGLTVSPQIRTDNRGYLFELIKSGHAGQIFVSRSRPGITRGNHYHHTKTEKFCVLEGTGRIILRNIRTGERLDMAVAGEECRVIDILPGWSHSITNVGTNDMITLFWASEVFDPSRPDTFAHEV